MSCSHCGQPIAQGARFCTKCGSKMQSSANAADPVSLPSPAIVPPAPSHPRRFSRRAALSLAAGLAILLACSGIFFWKRSVNVGLTQRLSAAIAARDTVAIRRLLDAGAEVNPEPAPGSISPLCWAADSGDIPMITLLLERGAKPNAINPYTPTPLFMAAYSATPNAAAVKLLIDRGADVNLEAAPGSGWPGRTALAAAQGERPAGFPDTQENLKQREEIVRILKQAGATR